MRLINIDTWEMRDFTEPPPYAILSHRWTKEELLFQDFPELHNIDTVGSRKVKGFCRFVKEHREVHNDLTTKQTQESVQALVDWIWIDTCCIDKSSSTELSEAINSMWRWYEQATYCVAYLIDVSLDHEYLEKLDDPRYYLEVVLRESKWFTRGWTLQELLAPKNIVFCDLAWTIIDSRKPKALWSAVEAITGVQAEYLTRGLGISSASVARRMSWASCRETTRPEDMAYCLMGLFQVTIPLMYGEGKNAFRRLQEEIIKQSADESIFAWTSDDSTSLEDALDMLSASLMLAPSPKAFAKAGDIHRADFFQRHPYSITNKGLQIRADAVLVHTMAFWQNPTSHGWYIIQLNCAQGLDVGDDQYDPARPCLLALEEIRDGVFRRGYESSIDLEDLLPRLDRAHLPGSRIEDMTFLVAVTPEQGARSEDSWAVHVGSQPGESISRHLSFASSESNNDGSHNAEEASPSLRVILSGNLMKFDEDNELNDSDMESDAAVATPSFSERSASPPPLQTEFIFPFNLEGSGYRLHGNE